MGNYIDKTYAAVDGVLLSYEGNDTSLIIPCCLDGMKIHTIGHGAAMESENLEQVYIPEGIKQIGDKAFAGCKQLMTAYIPDSLTKCSKSAFYGCDRFRNLYIKGMKLSQQEYNDLLMCSRKTNKSIRLSYSFPENKILLDAVAATEATPANIIQSGIARLFTTYSLSEEKGVDSLHRSIEGLGFEDEVPDRTEEEAFFGLIENNGPYVIDTSSERQNDQIMRSEKEVFIRRTAVFTFDDSKTVFKDGIYYVFPYIKIGYHFWQSKVPVVSSGITYYIYRRHYLCSEPNLNYIRRDVAVFTESGLVSNKKEAQKVYAKYKLLSIL